MIFGIQIVSENVSDLESKMRGSVRRLLDSDQLEVELKKSVSNLNINWSV